MEQRPFRIISIATPLFKTGGGESILRDLSLFFKTQAQTVEHSVCLLTISTKLQKELADKNIVTTSLTNIALPETPSKGEYLCILFKLLAHYGKLKKILKEKKADILVVHGFPGSFLIGTMAHCNKEWFPKLIYVHHSLKRKEPRILRKCYQSMLKPYSTIVAVSSLTKQSLSTAFPDLTQKIVSIPNAINIAAFKNVPEKEALRRELGLPEGTLAVMVGRFAQFKNQQFLVEVYDRLKGKNLQWKLLFIGNGETLPRVQELVKSKQLSDNIFFVGYQEPEYIARYLSACDLFLYPSLNEGFGLVVVEAMASGLPTLIFNNIYIDEFGDDIMVAKNNEDFVLMTEALLSNPMLRETIGNKLRAYSLEHFDITAIGMQWIRLFQETMNEETPQKISISKNYRRNI